MPLPVSATCIMEACAPLAWRVRVAAPDKLDLILSRANNVLA
jgi:hypothetical protein